MLRKVESLDFEFQPKIKSLLTQINKVILDKSEVIKLSLCTILSEGHLLIEDSPGMGKTSLVKSLTQLLGLPHNRIQFTNDMLPADILGANIWDKNQNNFSFHKGPLFSNFILADEINRASPKTQSALLQAMEEGMVSIDGTHYQLPEPFFLIATQNPTDNFGTFPLPLSQMDRFLMRIELGYPSREAERKLLTEPPRKNLIKELKPVFQLEELQKLIIEVQNVFISDIVIDYVQDLVEKSRTLSQGLSPRAALDIIKATKSWTYIEGRNYALPEDVQAIAVSVMNHRLSNDQSSTYELAKEIVQSTEIK